MLESDKIDVNAQNLDGKTPLHIASINGNLQILQLFLNNSRVDFNIRQNVFLISLILIYLYLEFFI